MSNPNDHSRRPPINTTADEGATKRSAPAPGTISSTLPGAAYQPPGTAHPVPARGAPMPFPPANYAGPSAPAPIPPAATVPAAPPPMPSQNAAPPAPAHTMPPAAHSMPPHPSSLPGLADAGAGVSLIRNILFGEIQDQYEARIRTLEQQIVALREENRVQFESWAKQFTTELGELLKAMKAKMDATERALQDEQARLGTQLDSNDQATRARLDGIDNEIKSVKSGFSAISTVVMDEIKDAEGRLSADIKKSADGLRLDVSKTLLAASQALGGDAKTNS